MENHQVEQGECLSSIADRYGFFWQTLWNHPQNAELKKKRTDPNILLPGDVVHIPDKRLREEAVATGQVHRFRMKNIPAKLSLRLLYESEPRRDEAYTLDVDGQIMTGKTNADGQVRVSILPSAKNGILTVGEGARRTIYRLQLGQLDPVSEMTGVQARLRNLGFYRGEIDGEWNEETRQAWAAFQASVGLSVTDHPDAATQQKLQQTHERK